MIIEREGGFCVNAISTYVGYHIRIRRIGPDKRIIREPRPKPKAGDEAVKTVCVEDFGGEGKVLFEFGSLLIGERFVQFAFQCVPFLQRLLYVAAGADAAFSRGYVSVI